MTFFLTIWCLLIPRFNSTPTYTQTVLHIQCAVRLSNKSFFTPEKSWMSTCDLVHIGSNKIRSKAFASWTSHTAGVWKGCGLYFWVLNTTCCWRFHQSDHMRKPSFLSPSSSFLLAVKSCKAQFQRLKFSPKTSQIHLCAFLELQTLSAWFIS